MRAQRLGAACILQNGGTSEGRKWTCVLSTQRMSVGVRVSVRCAAEQSHSNRRAGVVTRDESRAGWCVASQGQGRVAARRTERGSRSKTMKAVKENREVEGGIKAGAEKVIVLQPELISEDSFKRFGQVIRASEDGCVYGENDAKLDLSQGKPRFYIMRLRDRQTMQFNTITHHARVTQCLGGLGNMSWYIAVAEAGTDPSEMNMEAFEVPPGVFIKLNVGTWHAGPHFQCSQMDFYNLELADTNVIDHHNKNFDFENKQFIIKPREDS